MITPCSVILQFYYPIFMTISAFSDHLNPIETIRDIQYRVDHQRSIIDCPVLRDVVSLENSWNHVCHQNNPAYRSKWNRKWSGG